MGGSYIQYCAIRNVNLFIVLVGLINKFEHLMTNNVVWMVINLSGAYVGGAFNVVWRKFVRLDGCYGILKGGIFKSEENF